MEISLSREAHDIVSKKQSLHSSITQLAHVATSMTDKTEREAAAASLVNEVLLLMKKIHKGGMEREAMLVSGI